MNFENEEQKPLLLGETGFDNPETENDSKVNQQVDDTENFFGKPEQYDYSEVELPENYTYNEELLNEFNDLASKFNLSQKSANELMNIAIKHARLMTDNFANALAEEKREQTMRCKHELMNDPYLGRGRFNSVMQTANSAYKAFATDDVQKLLSDAGLNCHPKIVGMFYKIGKSMSDDSLYGVNSAPVIKESREDILYPTMQY